jgi:hypothetical protein
MQKMWLTEELPKLRFAAAGSRARVIAACFALSCLFWQLATLDLW